MQINEENYELFFLMYADNELSISDRAAVEAFVTQHPHLKMELDLLLDTVLMNDDVIAFEGKQKLLVKDVIPEADLLTYLDGEATLEMRQAIAKVTTDNEIVKAQIEHLSKLYVQPDTDIVYPNKSQLYRRATVRSMNWKSMAVAASLTLFISSWLFFYKEEEDVAALPVAVQEPIRDIEHLHPNINVDTLDNKAIGHSSVKPSTQKKINESEPVVHSYKADVAPKKTPPTELNTQHKEVINRVVEVATPTVTPTAPTKAVESELTKTVLPNDRIVEGNTSTQTTTAPESRIEKKHSLLKKIGKQIGGRALDILSGGEDEINIAGVAINIKK